MTQTYEDAPEYDGAYTVRGYKGVAWRVWGWQTEPDEDTIESGLESRTGKLVAVMVGDDRQHYVDPDQLTLISEEDYCGSCGQLGCGHTGG